MTPTAFLTVVALVVLAACVGGLAVLASVRRPTPSAPEWREPRQVGAPERVTARRTWYHQTVDDRGLPVVDAELAEMSYEGRDAVGWSAQVQLPRGQ